ncbi:MAG: acetolactate synthase large subunit, partial [Gemmatimonadetes bacterium]|nr:acetolactate synthase large subunit [Gemmatimonadota bacterium]
MNVAQLFVRCLEAEGVRYVFGVPGEENEDLLFALHESDDITFVPTRHEQGAAFIADVWGRLTGEAGVCLSTLGPGATNLVTGVADANLDKAPLVAITGQGSTTRLHHESHQYIDVVDMFRPITKWNASIGDPHIVTETVRKAFKIATAEKPGATHLELPEDVAGVELDDPPPPLPVRSARRPAPDRQAIERTLQLLASSERPLIVAGNGVIRKGGTSELEALAVGHGIPVVSTFMGKGAVSDRLDVSLFAVGLGFADYVMEALHEADLVLAIGYDVAEYDPEAWNPDGTKRIVHLDFQPADVFTHYTPDIEIVCDVAAGLVELHRRIDESGRTFDTDWYGPIRSRIRDDIDSYRLNDGDAFHVPGVLSIVREALPDHGLLISDVGSHKMWIARNFPTYCPGGCIISNGLASMGIAL